MGIREQFPASRGSDATQDVASLLDGFHFPSIHALDTSDPTFMALPSRAPLQHRAEQLNKVDAHSKADVHYKVEPCASKLQSAQTAMNQALADLLAIKSFEDRTAALKARLVNAVLVAARAEGEALALDSWQRGLADLSAQAEIALVLGITARTATAIAHHSQALLEAHPITLNALEDGKISWRHAGTIVDELQTVSESYISQSNFTETPYEQTFLASLIFETEAKLLHHASGTTAHTFASKAWQIRESAHPNRLSTRNRQAITKREMSLTPSRDGMSWLTLHLPAATAQGIWIHCTRAARRQQHQPHENRTLAQLRIDTAAAMLLGQIPLCDYVTPNQRPIEQLLDVPHATEEGVEANLDPAQAIDFSDVPPWAHHEPSATTSAGSTTNPVPEQTLHLPHDSENSLAHQSPMAPHQGRESHTPKQSCGPIQTFALTPLHRACDSDAPRQSRGLGDANTSKSAAGSTNIKKSSNSNRRHGSNTPPTPHTSSPVTSSPVNGSTGEYCEGIVDGVREDPLGEYLRMLQASRDGLSIEEPPLPSAQIIVTVPVFALLGLTEQTADLTGHGPIPIEVARKLLANSSSFLRVFTDPISGKPLNLRPDTYRVSAREKAVLVALAGSCSWPNCASTASLTEIDHIKAFETGGKSTSENLQPLCKRHHALKHFKDDKDRRGRPRRNNNPERNDLRIRGWSARRDPDGGVVWRSPSGRKYLSPPKEHQIPLYPKKLATYSGRRTRADDSDH